MGIDRIVDIEFTSPQPAPKLMLLLEEHWQAFGMRVARTARDVGEEFTPGYLLWGRDRLVDDRLEWTPSRYGTVAEVIDAIKIPDEVSSGLVTAELADSQLRRFGWFKIHLETGDLVPTVRFNMRRDGLMFMPRDVFPDATGRDKSEERVVEHERQEYHFMRTLFEKLPEAVQLDLFYNCEGFEDIPSYCFTRLDPPPQERWKEKRLPEFEQWCDEHTPEYWKAKAVEWPLADSDGS